MRVIKYLIYVKSFIILRHLVFVIFVKSTIYWDNPHILFRIFRVITCFICFCLNDPWRKQHVPINFQLLKLFTKDFQVQRFSQNKSRSECYHSSPILLFSLKKFQTFYTQQSGSQQSVSYSQNPRFEWLNTQLW